MSSIDTAVRQSRELERILESEFGARGKGLHEKATSIQGHLSRSIMRGIRTIAVIRNRVVHEDYEIEDTQDFVRLCEVVAAELRKIAAERKAAEAEWAHVPVLERASSTISSSTEHAYSSMHEPLSQGDDGLDPGTSSGFRWILFGFVLFIILTIIIPGMVLR